MKKQKTIKKTKSPVKKQKPKSNARELIKNKSSKGSKKSKDFLSINKTGTKKEKPKFLVIGIFILVILIIVTIFVTAIIVSNKTSEQKGSPVILDTNEEMTFDEFKVRYNLLIQKNEELNNLIQPEFFKELSNLHNPIFEDISNKLTLDKTEMTSCLENNNPANPNLNPENADILQGIYMDTQFAQMVGITGTPTIILNGEPIGGYIPYSELKEAIEKAIDGNQTIDQLYNETDVYFGDKDSKVVLYIYSDYYCGYSKKLAEESMALLKSEFINTNKIKYVPKDLISLEPSVAIYARCAEKQGKYFEAEQELFNKSSEFATNLQTAQTTISEKYLEEINAFEEELVIIQKWSEEHPKEFEEFQNSLIAETE